MIHVEPILSFGLVRNMKSFTRVRAIEARQILFRYLTLMVKYLYHCCVHYSDKIESHPFS